MSYGLSFILTAESRSSSFSSLLLWLQQAGSMRVFSRFSLFSYCHYGFIFDSRWKFVPLRAVNLLCWGSWDAVIPLNWIIALMLSRAHTEYELRLQAYFRTGSCHNSLCSCWGLSQLIYLAPCQGQGVVWYLAHMIRNTWPGTGMTSSGEEPSRYHLLLFLEPLRTEFKVI